MYLYFDKKGILKEVINDKPLRQGGEGNTIKIYVEDFDYSGINPSFRYRLYNSDREPAIGIEAAEVSYTVSGVPYNDKRDLRYFSYGKNDYKFLVIPTSWGNGSYNILSQPGTVELSVYLNSATIEVLGLITFMVEESTNGSYSIKPEEYISLAQWNYLKCLLGNQNIGAAEGDTIEKLYNRVGETFFIYDKKYLGRIHKSSEVDAPYSYKFIEFDTNNNPVKYYQDSSVLAVKTMTLALSDTYSGLLLDAKVTRIALDED